jgi:hypothetical protein
MQRAAHRETEVTETGKINENPVVAVLAAALVFEGRAFVELACGCLL